MTILNETVRLFFAMTALVLVGLLSSPITGNFNLMPVTSSKVTKVEASMKSTVEKNEKKKASKKLASLQDKRKLKLRKS